MRDLSKAVALSGMLLLMLGVSSEASTVLSVGPVPYTTNVSNADYTFVLPGAGLFNVTVDYTLNLTNRQTFFLGLCSSSPCNASFSIDYASGRNITPPTITGTLTDVLASGTYFVDYTTTTGSVERPAAGNYAFDVNAVAETPLPDAGYLFASGIGFVGFLMWRRRRQVASADQGWALTVA